MNKFLKVLLIKTIKQLFLILSFCLAIYIGYSIAYYLPIIVLILYLILYLIFTIIFSNKISNKIKLDNKLYNIYSFICWIISGFISYSLLFFEPVWNILPKSGSLFSGLEYILLPYLSIIYLIVISILKLIIFLIQFLIKKLKKY